MAPFSDKPNFPLNSAAPMLPNEKLHWPTIEKMGYGTREKGELKILGKLQKAHRAHAFVVKIFKNDRMRLFALISGVLTDKAEKK